MTAREIIKKYNVSAEVAQKLVDYQESILVNYCDAISEFLSKVDRYNEIKPYINNRKLNKKILIQYLESTNSQDRLIKDSTPSRHLINGLIGTLISYSIFITVVTIGWNTQPPSGFDFVSLALVAFIWLGFTSVAAWELPSNYRTRKILHNILKEKQGT